MDSLDIETMINYYFIKHIEEKLKNIFQESTLYRNNKINFPKFEEVMESLGICDEIQDSDRSNAEQYYDLIPNINWKVSSKYGIKGELVIPQESRRNRAHFINILFPQTLSLYCSECKSVQAFNFIDASTLIDSDIYNLTDPNIQVFSISYQCQMCKNKPEVFLIRRNNLKISIDGRSPIQSVEVDKDLPKNQREYIRKAKVAYNSGETLAALFFQRTFLEQYVREITNDRETRELELVFEKYKKMLTTDFNSIVPSLGAIYEYLSINLHSANPSEETYLRANDEIETHFTELRLFKKQGIIKW